MQGFGSMLKDYLEYYKISQTDFAERLGISTKHMNEILNGKTNISEELMLGISLITDIDVNLIFYVETKKRIYEYLNERFNSEKEINKYLNTFCINEMAKKKWITLKDSSSYTQNAMDLLDYLGIASFDNVSNYLNHKILYKKKEDADINKIYLWIKRCDKKIEKINIPEYLSSNLTLLLKELEIIRNKKFNEEELIRLFNKYGIYLVIEDALNGTKIRGCTMVKNNNPCIYITRYFKEKASFYFTLYHEIGHIKSDYNKLKNQGRLLCQVASLQEYKEYTKAKLFGDLKPQNILNIIGYNVDAKNGLSDAQRRTILMYAIEEGVVSKKEAINHISFLIKLNEKTNKLDALQKWKSDRDYLQGYVKGSKQLVGVNRILKEKDVIEP